MHSRFGYSAILLAIAAIAPASAGAQEAGVTRKIAVKTADLDLTRADGVASLDARIKKAINSVCPIEDFTLRARLLAGQCKHEALKGAIAQRNVVIARAEARRGGVAVALNSGQ